MGKLLSQLLKVIRPIATFGPADVEIKGIESDSRKVMDGGLFVAVSGRDYRRA